MIKISKGHLTWKSAVASCPEYSGGSGTAAGGLGSGAATISARPCRCFGLVVQGALPNEAFQNRHRARCCRLRVDLMLSIDNLRSSWIQG